jgi:hyperosmotically inducible periplasmic protein
MKHAHFGLTVIFCISAAISSAQSPNAGTPKPDNTATNKGDQKSGAVTADKQKANPEDRALTQKIRRSIMADKSLSTYAHNIKIISQNGAVTLKGPVQSDDEKKAVVAKAVAVAGDPDKVIDKVTVKQ